MAPPLFSIATVCLNCAPDALRTARNVLAQTYSDYEYMIKDGGSTDGTQEQLIGLGQGRVVSMPDRGIYDAMNQALTMCQGEYVCFMNAGDLFASPDTLSVVATHLDRNGWPDFVYGDIRSLVRHEYLSAAYQPDQGRLIRYPERLNRFYLFRKMICHQAWLVKRSTYGERPFDENLRLLADYQLLMEMILVRKVSYAHIPEVVAVFDGDGATGKSSPRLTEERQQVLKRMFNPGERLLYEAAYGAMRFVNRSIGYRWVYPLLSEKMRGKVSGM